jgi:hypothetical protein
MIGDSVVWSDEGWKRCRGSNGSQQSDVPESSSHSELLFGAATTAGTDAAAGMADESL